MDEFGWPGGGAGGEVLALDKADAKAAGGGVQGNSATGGASAHDKDVERIGWARPHQSRLLNITRWNNGKWVRNFLLYGGEDWSAAAAITGGDWGVAKEGVINGARCGGDCTEPAEAYGGGHEEDDEWWLRSMGSDV